MLFGLFNKRKRPVFGQAGANASEREALLAEAREHVAGRRHAAAEILFEMLVERFPGDAEIRNEWGVLHYARGEFAEAEAAFRAALNLAATYPSALANLGQSMQVRGRFADARPMFEAALRLDPGHSAALFNLAAACNALGDVQEAIELCERILAAAPDDVSAHIARGECLLGIERFAEGWRDYEWRMREPTYKGFFRTYAQPTWDGQSHASAGILIWPEQGFGDTLQFMRLARVAALRFPEMRFILEAPVALYRLTLHSVSGLANLRMAESGKPPPPFTHHVSVMSLPAILGVTLTEDPLGQAYLCPDETLAEHWRKHIDGAVADRQALKVGLVWAGNRREQLDASGQAVDMRRSVGAQLMAGLTRAPGCEFISLQVGARAGELVSLGAPLHDFTADFKDFADTAAVIASLDLVISVDTSVVHLVGAMGKPGWMLSRYDCCWRWGQRRAEIAWYPSIRPYYQNQPGEWAPMLRQVEADLGDLARRHQARRAIA